MVVLGSSGIEGGMRRGNQGGLSFALGELGSIFLMEMTAANAVAGAVMSTSPRFLLYPYKSLLFSVQDEEAKGFSFSNWYEV